jgi:hypothetical protein
LSDITRAYRSVENQPRVLRNRIPHYVGWDKKALGISPGQVSFLRQVGSRADRKRVTHCGEHR